MVISHLLQLPCYIRELICEVDAFIHLSYAMMKSPCSFDIKKREERESSAHQNARSCFSVFLLLPELQLDALQ